MIDSQILQTQQGAHTKIFSDLSGLLSVAFLTAPSVNPAKP